MSPKITPVDERLARYLEANWLREDSVLRKLRQETRQLEMARMQIAPEQGQFMALLVKLLDARKILEVGTFTGYSSLVMAQAMEDDGRVVCCDLSAEWTAIARKYWQMAGVSDKISLHLGPALETLDNLLKTDKASFDLAFIDADKSNYDNYYEKSLVLLKPSGVILLDNVFWGGSVVDSQDQSEDTQAIRQMNEKIHRDPRVDIAVIPLGDGLTIARKRGEE